MILKIEAAKDSKNYINVTKKNGSGPIVDGVGDIEECIEDILLKHLCEISDEIGEE